MRPIVNLPVPENNQATDIGNMSTKFGRDRACDFEDILADRQTVTQRDPQTDIFITISQPTLLLLLLLLLLLGYMHWN